jgi:hypothetical protein
VPLEDAVQGGLADSKPLANLGCGCGAIGVQARDLALLLWTESAACGTLRRDFAFLGVLGGNIFHRFDGGQLKLL